MKILIALACFGLLFVLVEIISRKYKLEKENSRKTVHIISGGAVAFLPLFMNFREIFILSLIFIPIMLFSKHKNIFKSIHQVKRKTYGEVYFAVSVCAIALLFPDERTFMYGVLVMGLSDGLASVIGHKYGRKKYNLFGANKSYIGSLAFFVSTLIIGLFIASQLPVWTIICLALSLTLLEGCLSKGLDNLLLPPLASGLLSLTVTFS